MPDRVCPETFTVPRELNVEFQTLIQRLQDEEELHELIKDFYDNLAYIYHKHEPPEYEGDYVRAVVLMTPDESRAFEAAYETAQDYHDDIEQAEKKDIYTTLALHALEEISVEIRID